MLSIIIPTLNEEKYLPIFLGQVKKQSFKDYEVIVADFNSIDKTVEIAKNFGCVIAKGGNPSRGRNEGAKIARGDILLFTDADNLCLPDGFLNDLILEFKKRNLGVASFPIFPKGNVFDKIVFTVYHFWVWLTQRFLPHSSNSILVKKEVHERIGGFDETITIAEDHYYGRQASKVAKFGFIKTKPVLTSVRRFERDGRIRTHFKYLVAGVYMLFFGPIRSNLFKYKFDYSKKEVL